MEYASPEEKRQSRGSNRKPKRPEPQLFHTVRKSPPPPPPPKQQPPLPPPSEPEPEAVAGPSEHELIMERIGGIIQPWEEPGGMPGDVWFDVDKLKSHVGDMLSKTQQLATKRNVALESVNEAISSALSDEEADEEEPSVDPELAKRIETTVAESASEDLVEPAAKHKTRSTDRIREVRTEEKKLYGKINKRMGQLGREVEEKESEIQKEKQKATAMEEELEKKAQKLNETAARLGTAEEAKKTANEKIKELETEVRELKKELAKPPPVPPMTKEEADKLRADVSAFRRAKDKAEEDLILRNEELQASAQEIALLNERIAKMNAEKKAQSRDAEMAMERLRAEHKLDVDKYELERGALKKNLQVAEKLALDTQLALESFEEDAYRARQTATAELYEAEMRIDNLTERLRKSQDALEKAKSSLEEAVPREEVDNMRADLEGLVKEAQNKADAAKLELDVARKELADLQLRLSKAEKRAENAESRATDAESRANDAEKRAAAAEELIRPALERAARAESLVAGAQAERDAALAAAEESKAAEARAREAEKQANKFMDQASASEKEAQRRENDAQRAIAAARDAEERANSRSASPVLAVQEPGSPKPTSQRGSPLARRNSGDLAPNSGDSSGAANHEERVPVPSGEATDPAPGGEATDANPSELKGFKDTSGAASRSGSRPSTRGEPGGNGAGGAPSLAGSRPYTPGDALQPDNAAAAAPAAFAILDEVCLTSRGLELTDHQLLTNAADLALKRAAETQTSTLPSRPYTPGQYAATQTSKAASTAASRPFTPGDTNSTAAMSSALASLEARLEDMRANYENEMQALRDKAALEMKEMRDRSSLEMRELREKATNELHQMSATMEKEKRELTDKFENFSCPICENIELHAAAGGAVDDDPDSLHSHGAARAREERVKEIARKRAENEQAKIKELQKRRDELSQDLLEARAKLRSTKEGYDMITSELETWKDKCTSLEQEHAAAIKKMQAEARLNKTTRKPVMVSVDDVEGARNAVRAACFEAEVTSMEKDLSVLTFKCKTLTVEKTSGVKEVKQLASEKEALLLLRESLRESIKDYAEREAKALEMNASLTKEVEALRQQHKEYQEGRDKRDQELLMKETENSSKARRALAKKLADAEEELAEVKRLNAELLGQGPAAGCRQVEAPEGALVAKLASEERLTLALKKERDELNAQVDSLQESLSAARMEALAAAEKTKVRDTEKAALLSEMDAFKLASEERFETKLKAMAMLREASEARCKQLEADLAEKTTLLRRESASRRARAIAQAFTKNLAAEMEKKRELVKPGGPSPELVAIMELKMKSAEETAKQGQTEGQLAKLKSDIEKYQASVVDLERITQAQLERISKLTDENSANEQRAAELKQALANMTEALEKNGQVAQKAMNDLQVSTKAQVRAAAEQAQTRAQGLYEEYRKRAATAENALIELQKTAESKVATLERDLKKMKVRLESAEASTTYGGKRATIVSGPVLPKEYEGLRGALQQLEEAAINLMDTHQAQGLSALLSQASSGLNADTSNEELVETDARRVAELAEALGTLLLPSSTETEQLARARWLRREASRGSTPSSKGRQEQGSRVSTPGRESKIREFSLNDVAPLPSQHRDKTPPRQSTDSLASRHISPSSTPSRGTRVSTPLLQQRHDPSHAAPEHVITSNNPDAGAPTPARLSPVRSEPESSSPASRRGAEPEQSTRSPAMVPVSAALENAGAPAAGVAAVEGRSSARSQFDKHRQSHDHQSAPGLTFADGVSPWGSGEQLGVRGSRGEEGERLPRLRDEDRRPATTSGPMDSVYAVRPSLSRGTVYHPHYSSSVVPLSRHRETRSKGFLTPVHRTQSVPYLGQGQQRSGRLMDLRPQNDDKTEVVRASPTRNVRDKWLAHGIADTEPDMDSCTVAPPPGARPISQPPMSRAARSTISPQRSPRISGSFWAEEIPALSVTAAIPAMTLQSLSEEAQSLAVRALYTRAAADLDELALKLSELKGVLDEETEPLLCAAIKQAGLQTNQTEQGPVALLSAPSTLDIVELLSALSTQVTFGVSQQLPTSAEGSGESAKNSGPGAIGSRFRREIALLRRTMDVREKEQPDAPITPRLAEMAQALIRREELTQRKKEVLRMQRARSQADLTRVRGEPKSHKGPKDQIYQAVKRMEEEDMAQSQSWEYRRLCIKQQQSELLQLTSPLIRISRP